MSKEMLDILSRIFDPEDVSGIYDLKYAPENIANQNWEAM